MFGNLHKYYIFFLTRRYTERRRQQGRINIYIHVCVCMCIYDVYVTRGKCYWALHFDYLNQKELQEL